MMKPGGAFSAEYIHSLLRSLAGQGFRMAMLSTASLFIGYSLTLLFKSGFGIPAEAAFGYAVLICSIMNFFGCRHYVFRGQKGALWQEAAKFFPSVLLFRSLEVALFAVLNASWHNFHLAYFATAITSMLIKLVISRIFIFKRPPGS